jgi:hypothetical protein
VCATLVAPTYAVDCTHYEDEADDDGNDRGEDYDDALW